MEISGSLFIHNAIKGDYCIEAVIASCVDLCEEIIVLDAESEDDTVDLLYSIAKKYPNVKVHTGAKWACERPGYGGYDRYAVLANKAKDLTRHKMHFMLQADEVLHEDAIPIIKHAVTGSIPSFAITRYNLYAGIDQYLRFDIKQVVGRDQPCNVTPIRIGHRELEALGDGESIRPGHRLAMLINDACLFHYGFVRDPYKQVDRIAEIQSWFHSKTGGGGEVDPIVIKQKQMLGYYDGKGHFPEKECFLPLPKSHPKCAMAWVEEKRKQFNTIFGHG